MQGDSSTKTQVVTESERKLDRRHGGKRTIKEQESRKTEEGN